MTITDGKNIERIETSDILTTQKLPRLVMFGFSINEKYIKSLGNALQLMRQSLPISTLYTGVGVLRTDEGTVISLDEPYLSKTSSSLRLMKSFVKQSMTYNLKVHLKAGGKCILMK